MLGPGGLLDRYELLAEIGSGELASVQAARLQSIGGFERLVAIKLLHAPQARDAELVSLLLEEVRLAACVRHANLVATLDVQSRDGQIGVVTEYVEGVSLRTLLQLAGSQRLRIAVAVRILVDALYGLQAVHHSQSLRGEALHLLHGDLSSRSLMVGIDGITRLNNLGPAGALMRLHAKRQRRLHNKLPYVAPEVLEGSEAGQPADLYSLGVVLWEALTGQRLLRAGGEASQAAVAAQDPLPRVSRIVAELAPFEALLDRALARAVPSRFQTAEPFLDALERTAQRIGVGVASPREVAKVVQTLAADRLTAQRHAIAAAASRPSHVMPGVPGLTAAGAATAATVPAPTTSIPIAVPRISQQTLPRSLDPNLIGGFETGRGRTKGRVVGKPWLLGGALLLFVAAALLWWIKTPSQVAAPAPTTPLRSKTTVPAPAAQPAQPLEGAEAETEAAAEAVAPEPAAQPAADAAPAASTKTPAPSKRSQSRRRNRGKAAPKAPPFKPLYPTQPATKKPPAK